MFVSSEARMMIRFDSGEFSCGSMALPTKVASDRMKLNIGLEISFDSL